MGPREPSAPALATQQLCRAFGADQAVVDVDLSVMPGQIHALVGLNGAGKTTLMRLLLGMLRPDRGRALVLDCDVQHAGADVWRRVGHMIGGALGYPELTVEENLLIAGRLHGLSRRAAEAATDRAIERLRLLPWADRRTRALSAGNRQRLGLASALLHEPEVWILDEPTSALDPSGVVLVRGLMRAAAAGGAAILVSSHHLDEVSRTADRISVMHGGSIVGVLDPEGLDLEREFFQLLLAVDEKRSEAL